MSRRLPNPVGVVALANAFARILSAAPHIQPGVLMLPTVLGALFDAPLYIFAMPHLCGFGGLGKMIFAATFLMGHLFHRPQEALFKAMGLCMLVIVVGAENEQSYPFLYRRSSRGTARSARRAPGRSASKGRR